MLESIQLPAFAQAILQRQTCHRCHVSLTSAAVTAAGIRREHYGYLAFFYETICSCGGQSRTILRSQLIDADNWPQLSASWQWKDAITIATPIEHPDLVTARHPRTGLTLLLRAKPLRAIHIHCGYTAEDGPILLMVRWNPLGKRLVDSILRVEERNCIRIAQLPAEEKLPPKMWDWVLELEEGKEFTFADRRWRKMRRAEIEMLIRDRLYRIAAIKRESHRS